MSSSPRENQRDRAFNYLLSRVAEIKNETLRFWCNDVLRGDDFRLCTASRQQHQAYEGGLLVHTAEVMEIAINIAASKCLKIDLDVLTAATIFHDVGKIYDYIQNPSGDYAYTLHQKLIRHLPRSYAIFMALKSPNVSEDTKLQVAHCILSHHGRKDWGSPVEPQTPEALALHFADRMSADCALDVW